MDHLQETDAACDYVQRMVQRVSMDVTEVRGDLERTNKYLSILRQGLGVQNENKCMLQRSVEETTRTVKRVDDQLDGLLTSNRGLEETVRQLSSDVQIERSRSEDLVKQHSTDASVLGELQAQVQRLCSETHSLKDAHLASEARFEVCQKELRELRRGSLSLVPKLEDKAMRAPPSSSQGVRPLDATPWSQKKNFTAAVDPLSTTASDAAAGFATVMPAESSSNNSGSSTQSKKGIVRMGSNPKLQFQQEREHLDFNAGPPRSASRAVVLDQQHREGEDGGLAGSLGTSLGASGGAVDDGGSPVSRLPMLSSNRPAGSLRASDRGTSESAPRLRFTATMTAPDPRKQT